MSILVVTFFLFVYFSSGTLPPKRIGERALLGDLVVERKPNGISACRKPKRYATQQPYAVKTVLLFFSGPYEGHSAWRRANTFQPLWYGLTVFRILTGRTQLGEPLLVISMARARNEQNHKPTKRAILVLLNHTANQNQPGPGHGVSHQNRIPWFPWL